MLTWAKFALLLLQVAERLISSLQQQKSFDAITDRAIAELAATILKRSAHAKEIMQRVNGLSPDAVDASLRELEPKDVSNV